MDLLEHIPWEPVESSNVHALFYHELTKTICVQFNNGGIYSYDPIRSSLPPLEIFNNFKMAPSVGRYLHNVIKAFPYQRWDSEADLVDHLNAA